MDDKSIFTLADNWRRVHKTIFYSSLFFATIIFVIFLFLVNPPSSMILERKIFGYAGIYFAFFIMGELLHYILFYLPNYFFYKRMLKEGREKEILEMLKKYSLEKLIGKNWFIYKEKSGLLKPSINRPDE